VGAHHWINECRLVNKGAVFEEWDRDHVRRQGAEDAPQS
jgi:hypothetical protein